MTFITGKIKSAKIDLYKMQQNLNIPEFATGAFDEFSLITPIQVSGSKTPIYIVHESGLTTGDEKCLSRFLASDQPIYGLKMIGMNAGEVVPDSIEAIAEMYIKDILKYDPTGPYAIAGYSFGGTIAFEIARQLQSLGKTVQMLGMIDAYAEPVVQEHRLIRLWQHWNYRFLNTAYKIGLFFRDPKYIIGFLIKYKLPNLKRYLTKTPASTLNSFTTIDGNELNQLKAKVDAANVLAGRDYMLKKTHVSIDLFRATKSVCYIKDSKYFGWKPYALRGVKVHDIPGDHFSLFDSPNVKILAQSLQRALDERAAE